MSTPKIGSPRRLRSVPAGAPEGHLAWTDGPTTPQVQQGAYGPVYVIAGEHRGKAGYDDDDDDSEGEEMEGLTREELAMSDREWDRMMGEKEARGEDLRPFAIVYFEAPLLAGYNAIPRKYLIPCSELLIPRLKKRLAETFHQEWLKLHKVKPTTT